MDPRCGRSTLRTALLLAGIGLASRAAAQSAAAPHGAFLGCFNLTQLTVSGSPAQFVSYSVNKCAGYCRAQGSPLNAISTSFACHCVNAVPSEEARAPEAECVERGAGVALFYNHAATGEAACRLANVKMEKDSFSFHYNDYHASFDGGVMTLKMEGSNGLRFTTNDGMHMYGMYQVTGKIDNSSGAVTAFYTRSSDDYNTANWGDFSEIDFEFLNGNPSVPSGLWLNSFNKGMSGGERLVKPEEYRRLLGLTEGEDASNAFLTFGFNWQPDQVTWFANGVPLLRRRYDEEVRWKDMKGVEFKRDYRPPNAPQHVTFSMWADQDQTRAFGGKLQWERSPFTSQFKDLRRVLCETSSPASRGPAWLYANLVAGEREDPAGGSPAAVTPSTPPTAAAVHSKTAKGAKAAQAEKGKKRGA